MGKPPIEAAGRLLRLVKDQNFFQPKTYLRLPVSWKDNDQVLIKRATSYTTRTNRAHAVYALIVFLPFTDMRRYIHINCVTIGQVM